MVRPRERLSGITLPLEDVDFSSPAGGGGGGGGGGLNSLADLSPEPYGLPSWALGPLTVPKDVVAAQSQLEQAGIGALPDGIRPQDLTPQQARWYGRRIELILNAVPGVDPMTAAQFSSTGMSLQEAIRAARTAYAARKPKSWWQHIPGITGDLTPGTPDNFSLGGLMHAAFVSGPEWLWRHTVVDAFQELGEAIGVPARYAQRLSPGQVTMIGVGRALGTIHDQPTGAEGEFNAYDPDTWPRELKLLSGALDFIGRITLDPTMLLGKARKGLFLVDGALHYVGAGAGASQRVAKLRRVAELNPEEAYRRGVDLIGAGRGRALANFMFGNLNLGETVRTLVRGETPLARFVDDVASMRDDPLLVAEILKRYGSVKRGHGLRVEHVAYLEDAAKRAGSKHEAVRNVQDALVGLVTGTITPMTKAHLDEVVERWNSTIGIRNEAVRRWKKIRFEAWGVAEDAPLSSGPRVDGRGKIRFGNENADAGNSLAVIDLSASRERATEGDRGWADFTARNISNVHEHPEEALDAMTRAFDAFDASIKGTADELKPHLDVWLADPSERKAIIDGAEEVFDQMGVNLPLGEWPAQSILDAPIGFMGGVTLRKMPVLGRLATGLEFLPHRSVNVHDPYWHDQITRMGRYSGMDEATITRWIDTIRQRGSDPSATGEIVKNFIHDAYRSFGISEEGINQITEEVAARSAKIYANLTSTGKVFDQPLYASQNLNIAQLADPRMMRALRRANRANNFATMNAAAIRNTITNIFDQTNNVFKRLMISTPRTGLRVFLEGQARALAYGFDNIYTNPLLALLIFPLSVVSPGLAKKAATRLSPKHLREIAIQSGDIGMNQLLYEAGLLSKQNMQRAQVLSWKKMNGWAMKHNYRKAQANFINDFMVNDELVRAILFDGDDAARAWLLSDDAAALAYRGKLKHLADASPEQLSRHFDDVTEHMAQMRLYDEDVQAILMGPQPGRLSKLDASDLIGHEADEIIGENFFSGDRNYLNKALDALVQRHLSSIEFIGRDYTTRRELYREAWSRFARAKAQGQKLNEDAFKTLLAGGAVKGRRAEHAIFEGARRDVHEKVKWLFYDMANQSRFSDALRAIFPFGNAYQEVMQTWMRIFMERPWVPHMAAQLWEGAGEIPGVSYTDPYTGEKMFQVPLASNMLRWAGLQSPNPITGLPDDVGWTLKGKLSGLNMVSSGLPIPGPFAQMGLRTILKNKPQFNDMWNVLFPYGDQSFWDAFQPGIVKEATGLVTAYLGREESNEDFARVLTDLTQEELFSVAQQWLEKFRAGEAGIEDFPSFDSLDDDKILNRAQKIFTVRTFARFFAPTVLSEQSPLADDIKFYRYLQEIDPDLADVVFAARGGSEAFKVLLEPETKLREGKSWAPPTKKAKQLILNNPQFKEFVDVFGNPGWDIFHESITGDLDPDFLRDQVLLGDRYRRTSRERADASLVSLGWDMYFQYNDALEKKMQALGIANINQKEALPFKQAKAMFTQRLSQALAPWGKDFEDSGGGSNAPEIAKLAFLSNMPDLQNLDSIQGLREYFALRSQVNQLMRQEGFGSLSSKKAIRLKDAWQQAVRRIVAKHPHFARVWGRYLERDNPADSLVDRFDETGVLKRGILSRSGLATNERLKASMTAGLVA